MGERGASLSGGQRARISLARAMYKKSSIYILDDPLSAVDAHVGKHLFDEVIGPNGFVRNETRILVTHQVHFLREADVIVIVENGRITRSGTYTELSNSDLDFAKLLQRIETEHEEELNDESKDESLNDTRSSAEMTIYEDDDDIPYIDGYTPNGSPYRQLKRQRSRDSGGSKVSSHVSSQESVADDQIEAEVRCLCRCTMYKLYMIRCRIYETDVIFLRIETSPRHPMACIFIVLFGRQQLLWHCVDWICADFFIDGNQRM